MKKLVIIMSAVILMAACNSTPIDNEESKRRELQKYKQQLNELQGKIYALETELESTGTDESVRISVTELSSQKFEHFIEVMGKVEADLDVNVSPESAGIIRDVLVTEGQQVMKGQILGRLSTDALERTLDELQVQLEMAETNFTRLKNLWDQNIGSEMQLLQARTEMTSLEKRVESLRAQIAMSEIKSPVNGVVDIVFQKKGEIGSPQVPFAKVLNMETIRIYADVSESYLTKVKQGDLVNIRFPALGLEQNASITRIGNTIDPNNRTFRVRIDLKNPEKMIKPNLISVIQIRDYFSEEAIVVPILLIKEDFRGKYTFIAENNEGVAHARKVHVVTGMTHNNRTEVVEGLKEGMKIISEGYNQVADGTPVVY
jgi:membrane fusion protein, multidrug efflux system